jgi:hypothetical protein
MRHAVAASAMIVVAGLFAPLAIVPAQAQQARNVAEFCQVWQGTCNRTCPSGPGTCRPVCAQRFATCMTTQCYPFNVPGPRCFANATDRQLTDVGRAPNRERERQRRGL